MSSSTLYKKGIRLWLSQHTNILETSVWPMGTTEASLGGPPFSSAKHLIKYHIRTSGSARLQGSNLGGKVAPVPPGSRDTAQPVLQEASPLTSNLLPEKLLSHKGGILGIGNQTEDGWRDQSQGQPGASFPSRLPSAESPGA